MYVMTIVRPNGSTDKVLASGWTASECDSARSAYEARGCAVSFGYEVWN